MKTIKYFFHKFAEIWSGILVVAAIWFMLPVIRGNYDSLTPEVSGGFWIAQLYRLFSVIFATGAAFLFLRFNFPNTIGGYYYKRRNGRSDFSRDWESSDLQSKWRIVIFLFCVFFVSYLILHAKIG